MNAQCLMTYFKNQFVIEFLYCSIVAYRDYHKMQNVKPPIYLDASQSWENWAGIQPESCDLVVNMNMMHISPLACTRVLSLLTFVSLSLGYVCIINHLTFFRSFQGLFNGVGKILKPQGLLLTYGVLEACEAEFFFYAFGCTYLLLMSCI